MWTGDHGVGGVISLNNEVSEKAGRGWVGEDDSKSNPGAVEGGVQGSSSGSTGVRNLGSGITSLPPDQASPIQLCDSGQR